MIRPSNLTAGEVRVPLDDTTDYRPGWFGYVDDSPVVEWTHCRDVVQGLDSVVIIKEGLWYCHKKGCAENLCAFIDKVEDKLHIKERTTFRKTVEHNIVWVRPSPFWVYDPIRRSFFTMCLRCGVYYKRTKDNFMDVFGKRCVSRNTIPAIKLFLKGNTCYVGEYPEKNVRGWHFLFSGKCEDEILLVKPSRTES